MTPALRRLPRALALSAALALLAASCGSDEPSATEPTEGAIADTADTDAADSQTTVSSESGESSEGTESSDGETSDETGRTTTIAPSTTATPSTTEPDIDAPEVGSDGPVCAAYESLFLAAFVSVFSGLSDEEAPDLLLTAATPGLARAFTVAVASLPDDDVPASLEEATRGAAEIFADVAAQVEAAGVDPRLVGAFEQMLDAAAAAETADVDDVEADLTELLDDEQRALLGEIGFNFDEAFDGVPEPDEELLAALCPTLGEYLGLDGAGPDTDACAAVPGSALMTLFATGQIEPEPYRDDDSSLCSWSDGESELRVSLITAELVEQTRSGNAEANEIVEVPDLGDEAWVAPGLMLGVTSDGSGGQGGFGADRSTVGVIVGEAGLLVAVDAPGATDVDALAVDIAELIVAEL